LGIDSSSALGIDSSSALGIDSSSALGIDSSSALGIDSSSALGIDSSSSPLLAGPIQSIDFQAGTFIAVGQTVSFGGTSLESLRVGDYVMVGGSIAGAGLIRADYVEISSQAYVPGATRIVVTGIPSSVNVNLGTARIGDLAIDYTPSLGGSAFDGIGAAISVFGVQPSVGGIMLSDEVVDQTDLFLRDRSLR
jgi:hypothetical protein